MSDRYYKNVVRKLNEGEKNVLDITLKPFRQLNLQFINQTKTFNYIWISSFIFENEKFIFYPCDSLSIATFKIIPEYRHLFSITLYHKINENEIDKSGGEMYYIDTTPNDTTVAYYF